MKSKPKILVCADSFKGSLGSIEVADACREGILKALPLADVQIFELGDGGEGSVEVIRKALGGVTCSTVVSGPLGEPVTATYLTSTDGKVAYIEVSSAAGLSLVPNSLRNPMYTSTYGVGEIITDAYRRGCTRFIVGLGGSATNDGGIGMLQALGYRFFDKNGIEVGHGGKVLQYIASFLKPTDTFISDVEFRGLCDVDNPLTGPDGAASVFGPQKGATPEMVVELDKGLANLAAVIRRAGLEDVERYPGAGAAGGLGAAFKAFLNARLCSGVDTILELNGFRRALESASLVITGEGSIDAQTLRGKAPLGVLKAARQCGVPVIAIAGSVQSVAALNDAGFLAVLPIVAGPCSLSDAMNRQNAHDNISRTVEQALRLLTFPM